MQEKFSNKLLNSVDTYSLFSAMENVIDAGLILFDSKLRCLFVNERAKGIFNIPPEREFTDEEQMSLLGPLLKEFRMQNEGRIEKELRVNLPGIDGEKVVRTLSAPVKRDSGKLGYIICLWDLTSAKEKERLQSEFVSHVSHEMRTPLTVIKEFASILLDGLGGEVNSTQKEYLAIIGNNVERLDGIVGTLLDISKLEAGKIKPACEIANIRRLINQVVYMLVRQTEKKKIKLTCKFPHEIPPARIDVDKITQVLINLIENAFKYTSEGGSINVEAKEVKNFIEVSVSDTGIGIQLEDREKVFDKFYQIGLKPGPGAKGVGLGLAITKQIVLMHGGKIRVDSIPGKGSTFTFTVPAIRKIKDLLGYVTECIDFAKISGKRFTLMRITIADMKKLEKGGTKKEILHTMTKTIENELRKAADSDPILVKDNLFIGLPNTSRKDANILKKRLINAFSFKTHVELKSGLASYPEDAGTAEELIKRCLKQ